MTQSGGNFLDDLLLANRNVTIPNSATKTLANSSASVAAGQIAVSINGQVTLATSGAIENGLYPAGLFLAAAAPGASATLITQGPVAPSLKNLGAGLACAVGTDSSGNPVRVTDPSCISKFKQIGVCDANGTIFVNPVAATSVNVKDFGATGDGVTDDTAAIQAAVTFAKANTTINGQYAGIQIYFPNGTYLCSSQINFDTTALDTSHEFPNVTLYGDGSGISSPGSNIGTSTLIYTGTGSGSFISARSSANFSMRNMGILYESGSYTGTLCDFSQNASLGNVASTWLIFDNCNIGCLNSAHQTAAYAINLDGSEGCVISASHIGGADVGVVVSVEGAAGASVQTSLLNCQFDQCATGAILNPSNNTTIDGCIFEFVSRAVWANFATNNQPAIFNLRFSNNWCGDDNDRATPWVDAGKGLMKGCEFFGNFFGGIDGAADQSQKDSIKLGSAAGVHIHGNLLITVDFTLVSGGSYAQGVTINGNTMVSGNTVGAPYWRAFNNACACCSMFDNVPIGFNQGAIDQVALAGHMVTFPTLGEAPIASGTTHVTAVLEGTGFQGSNDSSGRITLTVASGPTAPGVQANVTFANAFDSAFGYKPKVFLQPETARAMSTDVYAVTSWGNFTLNSSTGLGNTSTDTYAWAYWVVG